jgi:hypothetical protein
LPSQAARRSLRSRRRRSRTTPLPPPCPRGSLPVCRSSPISALPLPPPSLHTVGNTDRRRQVERNTCAHGNGRNSHVRTPVPVLRRSRCTDGR